MAPDDPTRIEIRLPPDVVAAIDRKAEAANCNRCDVIHAAVLRALPDLSAEECRAVQVRGRLGKGRRQKPPPAIF